MRKMNMSHIVRVVVLVAALLLSACATNRPGTPEEIAEAALDYAVSALELDATQEQKLERLNKALDAIRATLREKAPGFFRDMNAFFARPEFTRENMMKIARTLWDIAGDGAVEAGRAFYDFAMSLSETQREILRRKLVNYL